MTDNKFLRKEINFMTEADFDIEETKKKLDKKFNKKINKYFREKIGCDCKKSDINIHEFTDEKNKTKYLITCEECGENNISEIEIERVIDKKIEKIL